MPGIDFLHRYRNLESYVGWSVSDEERLRLAWPVIDAHLPGIIDDFYQTIARYPETARVITGGEPQIQRLKKSLEQWVQQLFLGPHDEAYVGARRKIGRRHVLIGLPQSYVHAALARLRFQISGRLYEHGQPTDDLVQTHLAISKRMDLDMAIIEEAYQTEYLSEQQPIHESRLKQQRGVAELGERALTASCLDSLFEFSVALLADIFAADQAYILEGISNVRFRLRAAFGIDPRTFPGKVRNFHESDLECRSFDQRVLLTDDDFSPDASHQHPIPEIFQKVVSAATCPLVGHRGTWGLVCVKSLRKRPFEAMDQDCLQATANVLSAAIQHFQAENLMRQNERLAGIGQMITGLAHESRNALQRIQACTELLQMELPPDRDQHSLTQRIARAADDLHQLFEEVRQYAAPIQLERVSADVVSLWRNAWADVCQVHRSRDVQISCQGCPAELFLSVDPYRLRQVFRNVFENALAATPDPVRVVVQVEPYCDGEASNRYYRFIISDNGPGIDPAHASKAFDPFFTTKTKGTGLGLSICRRIIDAHGGRIGFIDSYSPNDSNSIRGAKIEILLPRS